MTGTWTDSGPISVPRLYHAQLSLADGRVLIAGGYVRRGGRKKSTARAELYDPATGIWSTTASLATARVNFTANLLNNGRVLVAGGSRGGGLLPWIASRNTILLLKYGKPQH